MREALLRFIDSKRGGEGRDFIRSRTIAAIYGKKPKREEIDDELVDEVTQRAYVRAREAESPPWTIGGIPGWVVRLTRREWADYVRELAPDRKHIDPRGDAYAWADRRAPGTDWGAQAHLVMKWLRRQLGDNPAKWATFELMWAHNVEGYTLDELAKKHHTTAQALADRFLRLRNELGPKVRLMDREKPRRAILLLLWIGGPIALLVVAIVLFLYAMRTVPPPPVQPPPKPVPSASASAGPAPSFDQALPPTGEVPTTGGGAEKPGGKK